MPLLRAAETPELGWLTIVMRSSRAAARLRIHADELKRADILIQCAIQGAFEVALRIVDGHHDGDEGVAGSLAAVSAHDQALFREIDLTMFLRA